MEGLFYYRDRQGRQIAVAGSVRRDTVTYNVEVIDKGEVVDFYQLLSGAALENQARREGWTKW